MIRVIQSKIIRVGFGFKNRKQNFFQMNPIYPDLGEKDFDIYNSDRNQVPVGLLAVSAEERYLKVKQKIRDQILLKPVKEKNWLHRKERISSFDKQTGFPIGIHQDFDAFIQTYKREKKVGSNINSQFDELLFRLTKHYEVKSELELIKIFRISIANLRKDSMKDKIRGLLMNEAFLLYIRELKNKGTFSQDEVGKKISQFINQPLQIDRQPDESLIKRKQLEEIVFTDILKDLDSKIEEVESTIKKVAFENGNYVPDYHPKYGFAIKQKQSVNERYDVNFGRGYSGSIQSNQKPYTSSEAQDRYIETRINRLYFLRVINRLQSKEYLSPEQIMQQNDLPLKIRSKDKIINEILYKYKEYDLMQEPDLEDIYKEIDIALRKINVKVVPNYITNQEEGDGRAADGLSGLSGNQRESIVSERTIEREDLLWNSLDVEEIFERQVYTEQNVNKEKLVEKELIDLSPSVLMELNLNKLPFNLYRHAEYERFGIFSKYRKRIFQDYISDRVINADMEFKFFSLEQAKSKLQRITRPQDLVDSFYGHAKRKSSQAQVFLKEGNGKIIINKEPLADYFGDVYHRGQALKPFVITETAGKYDAEFTVVGGGIHSQSECLAMALTKALIMINPKYKDILYKFGLVGTDDRRKECKKIGLYSARKSPPYVRR